MTFMTTTGATRFIRHGHACLGVTGPTGLTLTASGHNDSLLWSRNLAAGTEQLHTWSPWGNGKAADGLPGFNGERPDPVSGTYHLGNGYRAYNPILRRFNCPDSLSPFGAGGINPYAYCAGDPVNHTDPTGHISWQGILGIVAGTIGVLLTGGAALGAIAAAGSVAAAWSAASATTLVVGGLGLVADVTGIASGATEDVNPAASSVLGWVSMATGIAGMAAGAALAPKGLKAFQTARSKLTSNNRISQINLNPKGIGRGVMKYKAFSLEVIDGNPVTMGYISNFRGTGEEAILVHGTKNGNVSLFSHFVKNRKEFSVEEFIEYLKERHSIDLGNASNETLHLMSCYGVSNGVYERFANVLGRKVIGYGDGNVIATTGRLVNHFDKNTSRIYSIIGDVENGQSENLIKFIASAHEYIQ